MFQSSRQDDIGPTADATRATGAAASPGNEAKTAVHEIGDDSDNNDDNCSVEVVLVVGAVRAQLQQSSIQQPQDDTATLNVARASASLKVAADDDGDDSSVEVIYSGSSNNQYLVAMTMAPPKRKRGHSFRCSICLEDDLEGFKGYTLPCNHRFCIECLGDMVKASSNELGGLQSSATSNIGCPDPKCNNTLSHSDIQHIFRDDRASWNEYSQKASLAMIEHQAASDDGDLRRCPADRCNYVFAFVQGDSRRHFDCPSCQSSFCLQCDANEGRVGPAHPSMTCDDRKERLEKKAEEKRKFELWKVENSKADERFQELVRKEQSEGKSRTCPKCKRVITKNGGCDHMYCVACKTHFSWKTGEIHK